MTGMRMIRNSGLCGMQAEGDHFDPSQVLALVARAMERLEEPAIVEPDGLRLANWPTIRISIDHAAALRSVPEAASWSAWVDLTFMCNTELPFSAAKSHVIGMGATQHEALVAAVEQWAVGFAPPLISYIFGIVKFEADSWHGGDPRGVPGWACITG